jgi:hypothetical protein
MISASLVTVFLLNPCTQAVPVDVEHGEDVLCDGILLPQEWAEEYMTLKQVELPKLTLRLALVEGQYADYKKFAESELKFRDDTVDQLLKKLQDYPVVITQDKPIEYVPWFIATAALFMVGGYILGDSL